jgi:hypothetical protein
MSDFTSPAEHHNPGAPPINGWQTPNLVLEVDVAKYLEFTKDMEITEDQQRQLIEAMWQIMMAFADVGFGIHPVQQASAEKRHDQLNGGEITNKVGDAPVSLCDVLSCLIETSDDLKEQFNDSAASMGG